MKYVANVVLSLAVFGAAMAADTRVKMQDLPTAVQNTVKEQTKNATLAGLSKEVEKGRTLYEIETKVNGRSRDLLVDEAGAVVELEEQVEIDSIPAAAAASIRKQAAGGKVTKVESITQGSIVSYEAAVIKNGKNVEISVNADGSPHKN